jgi:hypothetical protein
MDLDSSPTKLTDLRIYIRTVSTNNQFQNTDKDLKKILLKRTPFTWTSTDFQKTTTQSVQGYSYLNANSSEYLFNWLHTTQRAEEQAISCGAR